jgi:hypothetical protein
MVTALTPNEATITGAVLGAILGAGFGAIVSFLTARYILKHGPNYGEQISNIHREFHSLARTQEEMRLQMVEDSKAETERHLSQERRAEAARWKPTARIISNIQGTEQVNTLRLESPKDFSLTEAYLVSPGGAKLYDYPVNGPKVFSTGCGVVLVHNSLLMIANSSQSFIQRNTFDGSVRYTVVREDDGTQFSGEVPFHAETARVGNGLWFKLQG